MRMVVGVGSADSSGLGSGSSWRTDLNRDRLGLRLGRWGSQGLGLGREEMMLAVVEPVSAGG